MARGERIRRIAVAGLRSCVQARRPGAHWRPRDFGNLTHMSFEGFSMTTRLTFPASMFSVVCQRCGSTLRKNADSCPNCGADRAAAFGEDSAKPGTKQRAGMFRRAAAPAMASAAAGAAADVPPSSEWNAPAPQKEPVRPSYDEPDEDVEPEPEGWNRRKTAIAGVCALVLAAGGFVYLQQDSTGSSGENEVEPSTQHSASGPIDSKPDSRPDSRTGGGYAAAV